MKVELRIDDQLVFTNSGTTTPTNPNPGGGTGPGPTGPTGPTGGNPAGPNETLVEMPWPRDVNNAGGQMKPQFSAFGSDGKALRLRWHVPADLPTFDDSHLGKISVVEIPGQNTPNPNGHIEVNGNTIPTTVVKDAGANYFVTWAIGNSNVGASFVVNRGDVFDLVLDPNGLASGISVDFASPNRY